MYMPSYVPRHLKNANVSSALASKTLCFFDSMLLWSYEWGVPVLLWISPHTYLCSVGWVVFPCFCFTAGIYKGKFGVPEPSVMITLVSLPFLLEFFENWGKLEFFRLEFFLKCTKKKPGIAYILWLSPLFPRLEKYLCNEGAGMLWTVGKYTLH